MPPAPTVDESGVGNKCQLVLGIRANISCAIAQHNARCYRRERIRIPLWTACITFRGTKSSTHVAQHAPSPVKEGTRPRLICIDGSAAVLGVRPPCLRDSRHKGVRMSEAGIKD